MGSKYTTQSASGYNSSPPSDDGSQTASNLIKWSSHKTKLTDPIKTLADNINSALVTALDYSVRQITSSDSVAATDHMKTVEFAPTATSGLTLTLADAATMTNNFLVRVKNSSSHDQTIGRATTSDTIEGSAADITIPSKTSFLISTTAGADGFLIVSAFSYILSSTLTQQLTKAPTRQSFTSGSGTYTTPSGCTRIYVRMWGAGGGGAGGSTNGTAGGDTTFSTLTASGGAAAAGAAGTGTNGDINLTGQVGGGGGSGNNVPGSPGGGAQMNGCFGAGGQTSGGSGKSAAVNSGGGGGGGGGTSSGPGAGGGSGGGYVEKLITSPSASYSYAVGAKGTGGTGTAATAAGGDGGSGLIIVDEFYN